MSNRYARSQIVLHWLTLLMVILTYAAMLLKDSVPEAWAPMVKICISTLGYRSLP